MASNPYVNKVVFGSVSIIDISDTTAVASDVAQGKYFYAATGEKLEGTATGGGGAAITVTDTTDTHGGIIREITAVDISDTTAVASDVASGKYFYTADGTKTEGTASGGGVSGIAKGTLVVASDVSSGQVKITDTTEIGFVPTQFFFYRNEATTTGNRTHMATYNSWGTLYLRTRTTYNAQSAILQTGSIATRWSSLTEGHLFFNSSTGVVYIVTKSTMILPAGTYTWIAVE